MPEECTIMLCYGNTDLGRRRSNNEDTFKTVRYEQPDCTLGLVCDGMGGAAGGEIASAIAADTFTATLEKQLPSLDAASAPQILEDACLAANSAVFGKAIACPSLYGMGSTLVGALCLDEAVFVVNVGDSRLYCFSGGELTQITHDHSFVQFLVDIGQITPAEAKVNPRRNIISRCIGERDAVEPDLFRIDLTGAPADTYVLLCSDGLTDYLADDAPIAAILAGDGSPEDKVNALITAANDGGGGDNITAVLLAPFAQ